MKTQGIQFTEVIPGLRYHFTKGRIGRKENGPSQPEPNHRGREIQSSPSILIETGRGGWAKFFHPDSTPNLEYPHAVNEIPQTRIYDLY